MWLKQWEVATHAHWLIRNNIARLTLERIHDGKDTGPKDE